MRTPADVLTPRMRSIVVALAVLSLLGTGVAVVFGARLSAPPAHATDSYSRGPIGHRGFMDTLTAFGVGVTRWNRAGLAAIETPLIIVEPERLTLDLDEERVELRSLVEARIIARRPTVLVLPKWLPSFYAPDVVAPGSNVSLPDFVAALPGALSVLHDADPTRRSLEVHTETGDARTLELQAPQRVHWGRPIVSDEIGSFVAIDDSGYLMIVSDPDLVHNATFHRGDNAGVVNEAISRTYGGSAVAFAEAFHGDPVHPSLASFLGDWPGVLFLVHLGALAAAVLLASRTRFGPARVASAPYGRGPKELIDIAANVLVSGTRLSRLSAEFVEHVLTDVHRCLKLAPRPTVMERARALDEAARRRGAEPSAERVLRDAHAIAGRTYVRAGEAFAVARAASRIRRELYSVRKDAS